MPLPLILASSSPYRMLLLERLGIPFASASPGIDERPLTGEQPGQLAERLAVAKARALRATYPQHLIIGSDQVAALGSDILGKPGTPERAFQQLRRQSGQQVRFHTSIAVIDSTSDQYQVMTDTTTVVFRLLDDAEIHRYLSREQPWDCAGSFKVEGLGIALFERVESLDPTALMGLPLIGLARMLGKFGVGVV